MNSQAGGGMTKNGDRDNPTEKTAGPHAAVVIAGKLLTVPRHQKNENILKEEGETEQMHGSTKRVQDRDFTFKTTDRKFMQTGAHG